MTEKEQNLVEHDQSIEISRNGNSIKSSIETPIVVYPENLPPDLFDNPDKYDRNIPLWRKTVVMVKQFEPLKPKSRETFLDQFTPAIIKNPKTLLNYLDNFDLITALKPDLNVSDIKVKLLANLEAKFANKKNLTSITPENITDLVKMSLSVSEERKEIVDKILSAIYSAPNSPEEIVDLLYNTSWALVKSLDPDIQEELLSILFFEKSYFNEFTPQQVLYEYAKNGYTDDDHLKKVGVVVGISQLYSSLKEHLADKTSFYETLNHKSLRSKSYYQRVEKSSKFISRLLGPVFYQKIIKLEKKYSDKARKLAEALKMFSSRSEKQPIYIADNLPLSVKMINEQDAKVKSLEYPLNLYIHNNDPLKDYFYKFIAQNLMTNFWEKNLSSLNFKKISKSPILLGDNLQIIVYSNEFHSIEERNSLFREAQKYMIDLYAKSKTKNCGPNIQAIFEFAQKSSFGHYIAPDYNKDIRIVIFKGPNEDEIGKLSTVIENYRPLIQTEQVKSLQDSVKNLRDEIKTQFARSISKRGYNLFITDPALYALGYRYFNFNLDQSNNILVSLNIDNQTFNYSLDSDFRLISGGDAKKFLEPQDQVWLELLTLSHIKKLICLGDEETDIKSHLLDSERQYKNYRKQQTSRVAHLRRLTLGRNYSSDAFKACLESDLPIKNLQVINKMRSQIGWGGTTESGIWTFVSGVEKTDSPQTKPIKLALKGAADDLRKLINLDQVSDEELNRIEQEILGEVLN